MREEYQLKKLYPEVDNYGVVFGKIDHNFNVVLNLLQGVSKIREDFLVSGSQSKFILTTNKYIQGTNSVEVYVNNTRVFDYEETSPTSVTITPPAVNGDKVIIMYYGYLNAPPGSIARILADYEDFLDKYSGLLQKIEYIEDTVTNEFNTINQTVLENISNMQSISNEAETALNAVKIALEEIRELRVAVDRALNDINHRE